MIVLQPGQAAVAVAPPRATIRVLRLSLGIVLTACMSCSQPVPPNVLFIAVDDLRPALGAYGDPYAKTPNIDRLARSGAVFLDAHVQQAVCNPSRASIMTGLRPDSIRVWDLDTDFRRTTPGAVTIPQHFMAHGYHALSVGKVYHNVLPDSLSWSEPEHKVPGFPYDPDAVYHHPDNVAIQEARKAAFIAAGTQAQRIDQFGQWYLKANATERVDLPDSVYYDGAQTNYAERRLVELKAAGKPFFFGVGFYRPHLPFNAPGKYWDMYNPDSIPLASNRFVPEGSPHMAINTLRELRGYADFATPPVGHPAQGPLSEADARRLKHGYYASVSYVDALVGRLLDQLDSLGIADNTIVVLWGDHGYKLGEHNSWAKMTDYIIDTRAPLIIRSPGKITPGTRLNQLVEFVDIYPTLAELAGLPIPSHLQGASAVSLLSNPDAPGKSAVFSQFLRSGIWVAPDSIPYMGYSMLTPEYHYVAWMNWNTRDYVAWELYDRRADPDENVNLSGRVDMKGILDRLEAQRILGPRAALATTR